MIESGQTRLRPVERAIQTAAPRGKARILVVEDDCEMRTLVAAALRADGHEVIECPDVYHMLDFYLSTGIKREGQRGFDVVVSDIRMPGITGLEMLEGMRQCGGGPPVIAMTAFGDEQTQAEAMRLGAVAFLNKPFELDDLLAQVRLVLSQ